MSVTGKGGVGIPIILLHDAEGGIITVETRTGELYRGLLDEAEDNMNLILRDVTKTNVHGKESKVELIYIKGSQVNFMILPDMLKKAPMFKRIKVRAQRFA
ncbi:small nuclear ribonucleoprotein [Nannochloropsis gaditana]|uniref:Small nuclear ribonucleoprotein Sm D3 n=1 Tax=Nannochloropsis gaditana TaxID=72520 RepID=W7TBA5_9STRA|nr:small nuclear ribonucleoprotein [Nannochloropsis gaditana]